MKSIKFVNSTTIRLNNMTYKGYSVSNLPKKFAFIYDEDKEQDGITSWFNYKGLTYVEKTLLPW